MKVKNVSESTVAQARMRLIEVGGRTAQDLGLGRIVGQILVYLYLSEGERSLDDIGGGLGLSKAAISVAVRQLESFGLVRRVWKKGDRKNYYRTADNIASALQQGLLAMLRQKIQMAGAELDAVHDTLKSRARGRAADPEARFVYGRVRRAKQLRDSAEKAINSPILRFFTKS